MIADIMRPLGLAPSGRALAVEAPLQSSKPRL